MPYPQNTGVQVLIIGDFPIRDFLDVAAVARFEKLYAAVADVDHPSAQDCIELARFVIKETVDAAAQERHAGNLMLGELMAQSYDLVRSAASHFKVPGLMDLQGLCQLHGFGTRQSVLDGTKSFSDARSRRWELHDPNAQAIFEARWAYGVFVQKKRAEMKQAGVPEATTLFAGRLRRGIEGSVRI